MKYHIALTLIVGVLSTGCASSRVAHESRDARYFLSLRQKGQLISK